MPLLKTSKFRSLSTLTGIHKQSKTSVNIFIFIALKVLHYKVQEDNRGLKERNGNKRAVFYLEFTGFFNFAQIA